MEKSAAGRPDGLLHSFSDIPLQMSLPHFHSAFALQKLLPYSTKIPRALAHSAEHTLDTQWSRPMYLSPVRVRASITLPTDRKEVEPSGPLRNCRKAQRIS